MGHNVLRLDHNIISGSNFLPRRQIDRVSLYDLLNVRLRRGDRSQRPSERYSD